MGGKPSEPTRNICFGNRHPMCLGAAKQRKVIAQPIFIIAATMKQFQASRENVQIRITCLFSLRAARHGGGGGLSPWTIGIGHGGGNGIKTKERQGRGRRIGQGSLIDQTGGAGGDNWRLRETVELGTRGFTPMSHTLID